MNQMIDNLSKQIEIRIVSVFEDMTKSEFVDCSPEIIIDSEIEAGVLDFAESLQEDEELSDDEIIQLEESIKEMIDDNIDLSKIEEILEDDKNCRDILKSLGLSERDFL